MDEGGNSGFCNIKFMIILYLISEICVMMTVEILEKVLFESRFFYVVSEMRKILYLMDNSWFTA